MKKNIMMRLASFLLVAVLISTSAISGTYAKYVTADDATDSARVAKFGVDVEVAASAFAKEYDATTTVYDASAVAIAKTVIAAADDYENLVAPGTNGTLGTSSITGTPEVAVNVKQVATLALTGWEVDGDFYCPITITIDGNPYYGLSYSSADDFIADVEGALENGTTGVNYAPNTDLSTIDGAAHTVEWAWAFEGTDGKQTDEKDTKLGDKAVADDITISFTYEITVTQID